MREINWSKYAAAFIITLIVFWGAFILSDNLNDKRVSEVRSIQESISLDILSTETQFDLLSEVPCKAIGGSFLSEELSSLASRITHTENLLGSDNDEVIQLKHTYFLLEAKDYLLAKKIDEECNTKPVLLLYFYSNTGDCEECRREGFVLTRLRQKYPNLRVYSFDYNFDSQIVKTLISLFEIKAELPAIMVDGKTVYGFKKLEELEKISPSIAKLPVAEDFATSTPQE